MKSIACFVATIAVAVSANAASVDWKITGTEEPSGSAIVYMVSAIDASWTSESDIATAATTFGSGTSAELVKGSRGGWQTVKTTAMGANITADAMKSVFLVMATSADGYNYVKVDMSAGVYGEMEPPKDVQTSTVADILAGGSGTFGGGPGPGPGPDPEPEPTSAMLMMLGVAGLALRRRAK